MARKHSAPRIVIPGLTALLVVAGCDPDAARVAAPEQPLGQTRGEAGQAVITEARAMPRFHVSLQAMATPRLDSPIRIAVAVRGVMATELARVVLSAPELEITKLTGGVLRDLPPGTQIPAILDRRVAVGAGQTIAIEGTLSISTPGYFRVTATAEPVGVERPFSGGQIVQNVVSSEIWIGVDENGGVVTRDFDPTVFADTLVAVPGPRVARLKRRAGAVRGAASSSVQSTYSGTLRYNNNNFSPAHSDPLVGATIHGEYRDWVTDEWIRYLTVYTNVSGGFTLDCVGSAYFTGSGRLENSSLRVGAPASVPIYVADTCAGGSGSHFMPSSHAGRVWATLTTTITSSSALFNRTRPSIGVNIVTTGNTAYFTASDRIDIDTAAVWAQYGFFVAAHEYGHAFHNVAIGGIGAASQQCPPAGHWLNGAYNLQCAYTEGFGDFYAALVLQDSLSGTFEDLFESPHSTANANYGLGFGNWCQNSTSYQYGVCTSGGSSSSLTRDGARAETAVAAFLYDLADGAATANGSPGSDDDAVAFGAAWVGDVINSCMALANGLWARNNGVDHLVYCFERRIGPYAQQGYFPTRSPVPSLWSSGATSPPGWSADAVTSVWQQALYPNGAPTPPPQPFSVTISGPTEVQPYGFCLYQALPLNGTPPLSFAWTADGVAVGTDSPYYYHAAGASAFELAVTVTDAQGIAWNSLDVIVNASAPECLYQ